MVLVGYLEGLTARGHLRLKRHLRFVADRGTTGEQPLFTPQRSTATGRVGMRNGSFSKNLLELVKVLLQEIPGAVLDILHIAFSV